MCSIIVIIPLTETDQPTLDDLSKYISPRYASQWKDVGRLLSIRPLLLEIICDENRGDTKKCSYALWRKWLDADPHATWKKLFTATKILSLGMLYR